MSGTYFEAIHRIKLLITSPRKKLLSLLPMTEISKDFLQQCLVAIKSAWGEQAESLLMLTDPELANES